MKHLMVSLALGCLSTLALADGDSRIDPGTTQFPWMNSSVHGAVWKFADHANGVTVLEAYSVNCGYCNRNAAAVNALADDYKDDARVTVLDLGVDTADRDYRRWIAKHKPNHPVVKDVNQAVYYALRQTTIIPTTFVVACDGTLVAWTSNVWDDAAEETLRNGIAKAEQVTCD